MNTYHALFMEEGGFPYVEIIHAEDINEAFDRAKAISSGDDRQADFIGVIPDRTQRRLICSNDLIKRI